MSSQVNRTLVAAAGGALIRWGHARFGAAAVASFATRTVLYLLSQSPDPNDPSPVSRTCC